MTAGRRTLRIECLDDIMPEVYRLLGGYGRVGDWSLGQACNHLATGFNLLLTGRLEVVHSPRSDALKNRFFQRGKYPDQVQVPHPDLLPSPVLDDRNEANALRDAVGWFSTANGPFPDHPMLGSLTKEEWDRFHCMHAAHHLGFLVPLPAGAG